MSLVSKKSLFKSAAWFAGNFPLLGAGQLCMPADALDATVAPTYDDDGNMIIEGEGKTYTWDAENRLIAVTLPNGEIVKYAYDAGSHRLKREHLSAGKVETTLYAYDDWNVVSEKALLNSSFLNLKCYTWGLDLSGFQQGVGGVGGLLKKTNSTQNVNSVFYYLYDANANVCELLLGAVVKVSYRYDVFGEIAKRVGGNEERGGYQFGTKQMDHEIILNYYGYRLYKSDIGRWINRDFAEEASFFNNYEFLDGVNTVDYLGLFSLDAKPDCERALSAAKDGSYSFLSSLPHPVDTEFVSCVDMKNTYGVEFKNLVFVKDAIAAMKKKGCGIPHAECVCCGGRDTVSGTYSNGNITICYDKVGGYHSAISTIVHEYSHAYDDCFKTICGASDCEKSACTEIRAYQTDGSCLWLKNDSKAYKECVIKNATRSTSKNPGCSRKDVEKMWEKCKLTGSIL